MALYSIEKTPKDFLFEIAQRVKLLRKQKKYSQKEMAFRSNLSLGSYKRFETTGQISFESLLQIAFVINRLDDFDSLFVKSNSEEIKRLFE
jgi:transcriptional regulator with XRE-family HTH domain